MEFVEGAASRVHLLMVLPRFGDHHHNGFRQRPSRQRQKFQHIVKHGRIAAGGVDDGQQVGQIIAKQFGLEAHLAGVHPVDVAAQRIDLAVVDDVAVRMGTFPTGEGVGAEAGVDQGQAAGQVGFGEVGVVMA